MKPHDNQTKYLWAVALLISLCIATLASFNESSNANESLQYALGLLIGGFVLPILLATILAGAAWIIALFISSKRIRFTSWLNIWALIALALVLFLSVIWPYWLKPHIASIDSESRANPIAAAPQASTEPRKWSVPPKDSVYSDGSISPLQEAEQAIRDAESAVADAQEAANYVPKSSSDAAQRLLASLLECKTSPQSGSAIRSMYDKGYLVNTNHGLDGIPVFQLSVPVSIFGHKVTYIAGWQREPDGSIAKPFMPTSKPRIHIAASFNAPPESLRYSTLRTPPPFASHSEVIPGQLDGSSAGSTITCYAD